MQIRTGIVALLGSAAVTAAAAVVVDVHVATHEPKRAGPATHPLQQQHFPVHSSGVVNPVESCGGSGLPVQVRLSGCDGPPPCSITPNTDTLLELDWVPNEDYDRATLEVIAETSAGAITVAETEVGPGRGGEGNVYTAGLVFRVSNALSQQAVGLVARIKGEGLMLCVRFPSLIAFGQDLWRQEVEL